ncbi:MAG: hypothetical protein IJ481_00475, partial [Alphaproteobacteria bacterium]|nr:hypothetical protein [Alphaproteobacteria bacterium]
MSLYASIIEVNNPIKIGNYKGSNTKVATDLTNTDYNYWKDSNTYVFNATGIYWKTTTVTIDEDYTLKLITNYTNDYYYYVLYCKNTFTNNGNVIIDNYSALGLNNNYTSNNYGTIDIINGVL